MKNVNYLPIGTVVFSILVAKIEKYIVKDVYIDIKESKIEVKYKLENLTTPNHNTHLNHDQIFESLEDLKAYMLKQFDELEPKDVGEKESKKQEEVVS